VWGQVSTSTTPTLKATPRQHSIDLRNNNFFFFSFSFLEVHGVGPETGWAHMIGPEMGPKKGWGEALALYSFPMRKKQWLKAKDGNPPPIRKKNNQKKRKEKNK